MKINLLLILLFAVFVSTNAQNSNLFLQITTADKTSPEFATLFIKTNTPDSAIVHTAVLDESGKNDCTVRTNVPIIIIISKIGYAPYRQVLLPTQPTEKLSIELKLAATQLSELVVTHKEKLVKQEDDKIIVDAEPLSKLATNAFEVIQKVPGVIVIDDNIYLGKADVVKVFINGREMKLTGSDLAAILKGMPPNAIAKIEVLNTPSAKYDASSTGGIINIILKKGVRLGTNGTANIGYNQGRFARYFGGFTLNHGNEKQNNYFNYQYNKRNGFDSLNTTRFFPVNDTRLVQQSYTTTPSNNHYVAAGFDRTLNPKDNLANDINASIENANTDISSISNTKQLQNEQLLAAISSNVENKFRKVNINNTLNFNHKLDTIDGMWRNSFNYVFQNTNTNQVYANIASLPINSQNNGNGDILNDRHFISLTSDYNKKIKHGINVESGIKLDFTQNTSKTTFYTDNRLDNTKSINYRYTDNINAAYLQASKKFYGITLKTGVRVEHTNMKGRQTYPNDTNFIIRRTDFFPYVYLRRNLLKMFGSFELNGNLIAKRSITRPNYSILNPAIQYTDPFFLQTGNPALKPQFTDTYEFNISYNDYPIFAFGMDNTKNVFGKVVYQNTNTKVFTETYDNLGNLRQYYMRFVAAIPPGGKFFMVGGLFYNYQIYEGLYQNEKLDFRRGTWSFFAYQELKFTKNLIFSLSGFMRIKGVQNFYDFNKLGELTMSLNKKFPKKNLQLILTMNDVFYTMRPVFKINVGGISAEGRRSNDTQRIGLTMRYNFGLDMLQNKKKTDNNMNVFDMANPK